jgi:hypothetical protein
LGPREDGVVIGDGGHAVDRVRKQVSIHTAHGRDHAVARRSLDQVWNRATRALSGEDEGAVLDDRAGVEETLDVLLHRALAPRVAALHCGRAVLVPRLGASVEHLPQVVANVVEIDLPLGRGIATLHLTLLDQQKRVVLVDRVANLHIDATHGARDRSANLVLHLHRLHDEQQLIGTNPVAFGDIDADDRALERGLDENHAVRGRYLHLPR